MIVGPLVGSLLVSVGGYIVPAYSSFQALKSADKSPEVAATWLRYWVIFALFALCESVLDVVLSWAPFYYEAKVGFIVWLQLERTRGANVLYQKLEPLLNEHQGTIDDALSLVLQRLKNFKAEDVQALAEWAGSKGASLRTVAASAAAASTKAAAASAATTSTTAASAAAETQADQPQEPEDVSDAVEVDKVEVEDEQAKKEN